MIKDHSQCHPAAEPARAKHPVKAHWLSAIVSRCRDDDAWGNLMTAGQRGDRDVYRQLLTRVADWLRHFLKEIVPATDVEQVIVDTLVIVHKVRHTYTPGQHFERWLTAVASYNLDQYRTRNGLAHSVLHLRPA